jgi:glycine/D-amino acid oxidase-like deaminating enzyme/nitrite reductase/ring-hydroxylating ferredoxin subunit
MERSTTPLHGSGHTLSAWMPDVDTPAYPALAADAECDVCVVGAGISGLTTAYLLTKAGQRVVVLDDGPRIADGESARTTGHVATSFDDYYHKVEQTHGAATARLVADSFAAAVNRMEYIVREEDMDPSTFERLDGYWFVGRGDTVRTLDDELAATHRAGLVDTERLARVPGGAFDPGPVLRFPRQGQVHILKYLTGLARAVEREGGRIFCSSHVTGIEDGTPCRVTVAQGHTVTARDVVVATNTPINDRYEMHTKQAPYRTYVIAARVRRGVVAPGLYWDTEDPYHYVRLKQAYPTGTGESGDADLLIVGGEDHKTGQADDLEARFERLEQWTRERFPIEAVEFRWSGQVMEPADYLPYIGRNPLDQHIYIVTGDSGNGMSTGTIAGILLTDLLVRGDHPWAEIYSPARKPVHSLSAVGEFIKENVNVVAQYADYVTGGDVKSPDAIPPGEGAVLQRGARPVAVYKATDGSVTERSAICPHLKCVVHWNTVEKSWDCPCHGSRFAPDGRVLNGPSRVGLPELDADAS